MGWFDAEKDRQVERDKIDLMKKQTDAALVEKGYDPNDLSVIPGSNADVERAQNQQTLQLAKALQSKLAAQDTDNAMVDYASTGDANYLQKALDGNPTLKQAWSSRGVQQIANIDFGNDAKLLSSKGFKPSEYDTPEKQDILKKNIYKSYDGQNWNVGLINNAVQETGALTRMGARRAQPLIDNHQAFRDFMAGPRSSANTAEGHKYETEINDASEATKVPANLLASMMNVESGGDPNAVSSKGASGLMQLKPTTAQELGVKNINDPAQNIMAGAQYMAKMLDKYNGNTRLALAAYNAGPGAVDKYGDVPPYSETQNYVQKVVGNYANGESYYNAGKDVIDGIKSDNKDSVRMADNRIATIQNFYRDQANAAKGTTTVDVHQEVTNKITELGLKDKELEQNLIKMAIEAKKNENEGKTGNQKDLEAAQVHTQSLLSNFGGEESFNNTDFTDQKNFNKAYPDVVAINKLEGTNYTEADKKNIGDIRALISLGGSAKDLSADQTGYFDKQFADVKKSLSDNVDGIDASSAYAAFRNSVRHALYGSALTEGEINSFNEAFGNRGQKLGPVLEQFQTALSQVKAKLDTVANLGNPYTSKVLIGADQKKLLKIQDALQARIDYMQGLQTGKAPAAGAKDQRPALDDIFKGK